MKLSVVIVSYNVRDYLENCLQSVSRALEGIEGEVFVVDNHSDDDSVETVRSHYPWVRLIENQENMGFSRANNIAIREARGEYVLLLNPDTIVEEATLREVLRFMEEHPKAGGAGVMMHNADGSLAPESRRALPTPWVSCLKMLGFTKRYYMSHLPWDQPGRIEVISGAFCMLRREALDKIGLLDEDFFMYGEDLDLCFRAKVAGCKNYYTPVTNVLHFRGQSSRTRRIKSYIDFYNAMWIFVKKHRSYYLVPKFLIFLGIVIAASVGVFSRLVPQFWKIFLDLGVVFLWAACLLDLEVSADWQLAVVVAVANLLFFAVRGEYASSSLEGKHSYWFQMPVNLIPVLSFAGYRWFTHPEKFDGIAMAILCVSTILVPLAFLAWRRFMFWFLYFYRIFAKKRHRSILLGGGEDSLQPWFDTHNVISGMEILGCVSGEPGTVSPENRKHLLGGYSEMESICKRTDCHELLVVSNFSGTREDFDLHWLEKLGMRVFLLIGKPQNGEFALINLKNLH